MEGAVARRGVERPSRSGSPLREILGISSEVSVDTTVWPRAAGGGRYGQASRSGTDVAPPS
jgi:hypothetical protein